MFKKKNNIVKTIWEREIQNPITTDHKIYGVIMLLSILGMLVGQIVDVRNGNCIVASIILNISYGCFASTVVAWILDWRATKRENQKLKELYQKVYSEVQFKIKSYIQMWSNVYASAYKNYQNDVAAPETQNEHTWLEWYNFFKMEFGKCDEERKKHIFVFLKDELRYEVENINLSIQNLIKEKDILLFNEIWNDSLEQIIEDFRFEFYAADLDLKHDSVDYDDFWQSWDAINNDLKNYINNWKDIRYYNYLEFRPHSYMLNKENVLKAMVAASILSN